MTSFNFGDNEIKEEQLSLGLDTSGERYTPASPQMITQILKHYQQEGFPYIQLSDEEKKYEYNLLRNFEGELIIGDRVFADSTGVNLANSYHPHRYEVTCNNHRTALYVFKREWLLRKCIEKCLKMSGKVTPSALRSMLSIFEGVQVASNFPPATAKAIYEHFLPSPGIVWDMSCGWGGRLVAACSTPAIQIYQGTEPSTLTYHGNNLLADFLRSNCEVHTGVLIANQGSEIELPGAFKEVDLCFTSPPYYNCEKYSHEETQSYIAYPSCGEWMDTFIKKTLQNCMQIMKPSAHLVVNIADVANYKNLTKDFVKTAEKVGFRLQQLMRLELSTMPGKGKRNRSEKNSGSRNEPIFVMVKK